jgi:hypothetical protein
VLTTAPLGEPTGIVDDLRQRLGLLGLDEAVVTWVAPAIAAATTLGPNVSGLEAGVPRRQRRR